MSMETSNWSDLTITAIDTETSGKYPLQSQLCELAAVKWRGGKIIDRYQTLVKPTHKMSDEIIKIHNITNEMVVDAPAIRDVISDFHSFVNGTVVVAHHAPFDLGFVSIEFERAGLPLPEELALCSSLMSLKAIPESPNHRLQTLIKHLGLKQGTAHRALDDAEACLGVALYSLKRLGTDKNLLEISELQGGVIQWKDYSMNAIKQDSCWKNLVEACKQELDIQIVYQGGSRPGQARTVKALGLVRNPNGDFFVASEGSDEKTKRYFLKKITSAQF